MRQAAMAECVRSESSRRIFTSQANVIAAHFLAVLTAIASITLVCYRLVPVNATTAGFVYLVGVLVIATAWGLWEATIASLVAMLCFNYFFFPPIGAFTIADPQNWVALLAFLATAIIASQLSARAKRQTREVEARRQEMERLYALSRAILLTGPDEPVAKQIARQIAQVFKFPSAAIYDRDADEIHWADPEGISEMEGRVREAGVQGTSYHDHASQVTVTAIRLGGKPIGSLAVRGPRLSDTALNALSNLVAIGLERVRAQDAANRAEAARQSEALKSTLLDAIAHEFKTPLTSLRAATTAMLSDDLSKFPEMRELLTVADEEVTRLSRLVTEAIQMARIEGGKVQLNKEFHSPCPLISAALEQMKPLTDNREVRVRAAEGLPLVFVDAELIQLAIRQVIENAVKYSSPGSPLTIGARSAAQGVVISVRDQGPGIPEAEQSKIFEKFYRSLQDRQRVTGSGMGLTIAREILRAHGGDLRVQSTPGQGSEFCLALPAAPQEKTA